jgi:hypothetical protein
MTFMEQATFSEAAVFLIGVALIAFGLITLLVKFVLMVRREQRQRIENQDLDSAGTTGQFTCPWYPKDWK